MSNNNRQKKRSNSFHFNLKRNSIAEKYKDESNEDLLSKTMILNKKDMISLKLIHNIDLTTYDFIFVGRQFLNNTVQDFESFIQLLKNIKNKFNPKLLKSNNNIENVKKDGKIS